MDITKYNLISKILNGSPNRLRESYFIKNSINVYNSIIGYTVNINDIGFKWKIWHWVNDVPDYVLCECGNRLSTHMNWEDGYKKFCSNKCSSNSKLTSDKRKNTLLSKYGVDHYSKTSEYVDKSKKTSIERYGVDNYAKTNEYLEKSKNTCIEKYGVDSYTKTNEYLEKSKKTCVKKYGVDNYTKTDEFKERFKEICNIKYGKDHIFQSDLYRVDNFDIGKNEFYIEYKNGMNIFKCDCGEEHTFEISTDNYFGRIKSNNKLCTVCHLLSTSSIKETMLLDYIKSNYKGDILSNYRDKYEIDIYLPNLKLGFEFNGLYWHSEKFKSKNYHLDKTDYFRNKGIRIIHIWEDDWLDRTDIIKSQILNTLNKLDMKIFARNCYVDLVNLQDSIEFLNKNHLQGKVNSLIKLGLYSDGELVSLMTFDKFEGRKKMSENEWNLNRFCNKLGITVVGGASKLLRYFINKYNPTRIISYADKDWSIGLLYTKIGFKMVSETKPDYKYVVGSKRVHKSRYRKSRLNTDMSESSFMSSVGILKVYDCGKIKFEITLQ